MASDDSDSGAELNRFRAAVLADAALQNDLQAFDEVDDFLAHVIPRARQSGYAIADADFRSALQDDPLGIARWSNTPPTTAVPQQGWLPINVLPAAGQFCIDWAWFGARPLAEGFFEDSARRALRRPLNRLVRHRTRLSDLPQFAKQRAVLAPSGLIFHMSRCGSTLASQMLASDPRNIVLSEAAPVDQVVRFDFGGQPGAAEAHAAVLKAMVLALGQTRTAAHERVFFKLDSWHTLSLPLFRRAFPGVPWIFMYREPSEVLASQVVERGTQMVPEYLPAELFGMTVDDIIDGDDYCARVLRRTCEAVLEPAAGGGGLLVNYNEIPQALWTRILPHFGLESGEADQARMAAVTKFDAKWPGKAFAARNPYKDEALTDDLRAVAERHLGAVYRALEAVRLDAGGVTRL